METGAGPGEGVEEPGPGEGGEEPGPGPEPGPGEGVEEPGQGEGVEEPEAGPGPEPGPGEGVKEPGQGEGVEEPGQGEGGEDPGPGPGCHLTHSLKGARSAANHVTPHSHQLVVLGVYTVQAGPGGQWGGNPDCPTDLGSWLCPRACADTMLVMRYGLRQPVETTSSLSPIWMVKVWRDR